MVGSEPLCYLVAAVLTANLKLLPGGIAVVGPLCYLAATVFSPVARFSVFSPLEYCTVVLAEVPSV